MSRLREHFWSLRFHEERKHRWVRSAHPTFNIDHALLDLRHAQIVRELKAQCDENLIWRELRAQQSVYSQYRAIRAGDGHDGINQCTARGLSDQQTLALTRQQDRNRAQNHPDQNRCDPIKHRSVQRGGRVGRQGCIRMPSNAALSSNRTMNVGRSLLRRNDS